MTNLCHLKRTLPAGGELVGTFTGKYVSEHQIVHLELPTMHKSLVIAPECLAVLCILESWLPSSFVNDVDIITRGADPTWLHHMPEHEGRPWRFLGSDLKMSSWPIVRTDAHQSTWHHASSSSHRCVS
jgi:hypothetical protein